LYQVDGRLNLKAEDFFADFKTACEFVINKHYAPGNKMEKPFLYVPSDTFNSGTGIDSGYTSSLQIPQQD
jgi:hypothetical protein